MVSTFQLTKSARLAWRTGNHGNENREKTLFIESKTGDLRSTDADPGIAFSVSSASSVVHPLDPVSTVVYPSDPGERKIYAMRLIAQRCLYGVDINPLAVEMCKLSLWLLTLAKDKPFEFLDHNIRCGDSLVGIHDLGQLSHFSLKPNDIDQPLFSSPWLDGVDEAIALRLKLEDLPSNTVEDVERQEKLLDEANEKIARLRYAADLLVAAEFWGESAKDKLERVRHAAVKSGHYVVQGPTEEFVQVAAKERRGQKMFHWPLEFPEVIVKRGGFDAFVGNPPFLGGKRITVAVGNEYRSFIVADVAKASGGLETT